jgi:nucleotide-binding universal stress UspA family protein
MLLDLAQHARSAQRLGFSQKGTAMDYKTILVHLDHGAHVQQRLQPALALATSFKAKLLGLFAVSDSRMPAYAVSQASSTMVQVLQRKRSEALEQSQAEFDTAVFAAAGIHAEWRSSEGDPAEAVCRTARYCDLVVLGQRDSDSEVDDGLPADFIDQVLLEAHRPVLLVPHSGRFETVGKRILIAWDAGREATHAVTAALPLLQRADMVQIVAFDPQERGDHGELPGADIGLYLARHGVKVSVAEQAGSGLEVAAQILSRAADQYVDLIVMGAYSRSMIRQKLFGGVTREILETMTVPVLMRH